MASNYPQNQLYSVLCAQGDFVIPPQTAEEAGDGRFSQQEGWGEINSQTLAKGGVAPFRTDFNGALNLLSQFVLWFQQGGIMNYNSSIDYEVGNEILFNGTKFRCLAANGPSSSAVTPGSDPAVWRNMDNNVPAGAVVPFANVTLGGSDGRRPIFWGHTDADEGWVICDGGSDGQSGTVPNLIGSFIKGSTVDNAGQTGGSSTQTLTTDQLPAHTHTITINAAGSHTHSRGTMNITGGWLGTEDAGDWTEGAIYSAGQFMSSETHHGVSGNKMQFDASRAWTGSTSSSGSHTHTATCSSTGSGTVSISIEPPFYRLAYFVKLPEA